MGIEKSEIMNALRRVRGPDLESNIVDLGLVSEVMIKDDEGHGFAKESNRIELYTAMDAFFKKYLAGEEAPGGGAGAH